MSTASFASVEMMGPARSRANPFPGLRPFRDDEEHLFFGRESQVDAMVDKLAATRFLVVVGASGSGKSSLVNCGLRPALHAGLMAHAGTVWRIAQFRPGGDPLHAMAGALARTGVLFSEYQDDGLTLPEIVETNLRMSKLGLIDIYEQAQLDAGVNLLVVVDQFEELFRYRQVGARRQDDAFGVGEDAAAFVNLLLEATRQTQSPIYVVLTMRSDFLGDCAQFPGLPEAINAGQFLVPRMSRDERRAAISGPVAVGGAEIAQVLLTRLVNDVGDNPDQLSILQHALNRTWSRWQRESGGKGRLELAHYEAIGTMTHALDRHAERAYAELDPTRAQPVCEKVFKALTDKASDPRGVRRPTTLGTLWALADATPAELTTVIDVFRKPSRSFLMPPAEESLAAETVIDISHESLMRVWQRLNTWADEEAQSAQTYRRLADTAALHAAGKASLWRDPDLQLALDWRQTSQPNETWAARYDPGFAASMAFLDASLALRQHEEEAAEAARQGETARQTELAEAARRLAREQGRRAKVALAGVVVALLLAGFAFFEAWNASLKAREAEGARAALQHEYYKALGALGELSIDDALAAGPSVPGAIEVADKGAWTVVMQLHQQALVTARSYRAGRILAVALDGVLATVDSDKTAFLRSAFQWLNRLGGGQSVRLLTGHCEVVPTWRPRTRLREELVQWGYLVNEIPDVVSEAQLKGADIVVVGNAWGNFSEAEINAINQFVSDGGGLLVAGLGWSFQRYGAQDRYACNGHNDGQNPGNLATYPMNQLAKPYGMQWTDAVVRK